MQTLRLVQIYRSFSALSTSLVVARDKSKEAKRVWTDKVPDSSNTHRESHRVTQSYFSEPALTLSSFVLAYSTPLHRESVSCEMLSPLGLAENRIFLAYNGTTVPLHDTASVEICSSLVSSNSLVCAVRRCSRGPQRPTALPGRNGTTKRRTGLVLLALQTFRRAFRILITGQYSESVGEGKTWAKSGHQSRQKPCSCIIVSSSALLHALSMCT